MVDNRGIGPVSGSYFKSGDASGMANKMSEEKYGQGGEYFAQEVQEQEEERREYFQDRSAQLRASLNGLALANAGSMRLMKIIKQKEDEQENKKRKKRPFEEFEDTDEIQDVK